MKKRIEYEQKTSLNSDWVRKQIAHFMEEDVPNGDLTTEAIVAASTLVIAQINSGEDFIFCGSSVIPYCFPESCEIGIKIEDGQQVNSGVTLATITGFASDILTYERVSLNLIQRLCGISTETKKYCDLNLPINFKVMDTRKTTPGLRLFEKYAVSVGGGWNHRFDLSSGILIKDNHLQVAGSVKAAVELSREQNRNNLPIELEVDTLDQLREGLDMDVDGFLLDNMSPKLVQDAVTIIRSHPNGETIFVEASGGINYDTLESYAWTGIDAVSMSAITTHASAVDIKLEFIE